MLYMSKVYRARSYPSKPANRVPRTSYHTFIEVVCSLLDNAADAKRVRSCRRALA